MRREATYFGAQNFVEKTTSALAPLILGIVLTLGRSSDDHLGIQLVGPVAAALVLAGYLMFRRYDVPGELGPRYGAESSASRSASTT